MNQQYIPQPCREFAINCPQCNRLHTFKAGDPFHAKCVDCGCYLTKKPPAGTERQETNQPYCTTKEENAQ